MVLLGRSYVRADVAWAYASSGWYMMTLMKVSVGPGIDPGLRDMNGFGSGLSVVLGGGEAQEVSGLVGGGIALLRVVSGL
jgi:hypothetical protein